MSYYIEPTHYEIAESNGIPKKHVDNRFYEKGWTIERAITQPILKRSTHEWDKWKDVSKVSRVTYMQRVRSGWNHERAALTPTLSRKDIVALSNDPRKIFTDDQESLMKKNNIHRATAYMRVKKLGWSVEKAVSVPTTDKSESLKRARDKSNMQPIRFGRLA